MNDLFISIGLHFSSRTEAMFYRLVSVCSFLNIRKHRRVPLQAQFLTASILLQGATLCKGCFFAIFEEEVHQTIAANKLFVPGDIVAIGASGGKG